MPLCRFSTMHGSCESFGQHTTRHSFGRRSKIHLDVTKFYPSHPPFSSTCVGMRCLVDKQTYFL